ncbi:MAG: FTR1 family protein [Anaerolineae bacterium]
MSTETLTAIRERPWRLALGALLIIGLLSVLAALIWQAFAEGGVPDPTAGHLSPTTVVVNTGLLVFREGLEAILVLAAITASFLGSNRSYRRPVAVGAALALLASVATWFVMVGIIDAIDAPALQIQAVTGVLAIVVLLVVMNWFFHNVYWTGWISHHNRRKRQIQTDIAMGVSGATWGLILLGFTAVYREGFEVNLFLQNLRLQAGAPAVLQGLLIGLAFTAIIGAVTFLGHHKLPYKKMLIVTGVLLGAVLVVMVGESVQELQLAGWLTETPVPLPIPDWSGIWFATFPNVEVLSAQALAALLVLGSYVAAEYWRVRRPRRRGEVGAMRAEEAPKS